MCGCSRDARRLKRASFVGVPRNSVSHAAVSAPVSIASTVSRHTVAAIFGVAGDTSPSSGVRISRMPGAFSTSASLSSAVRISASRGCVRCVIICPAGSVISQWRSYARPVSSSCARDNAMPAQDLIG